MGHRETRQTQVLSWGGKHGDDTRTDWTHKGTHIVKQGTRNKTQRS